MGLDAERCWEAVRRRDSASVPAFVFAVTTTGIYCRPECPARRPQRRNVQFFVDTCEARNAGFRACLRCHPDDARSPRAELVAKACRWLESRVGERAALQALAAACGVSPFHLHRVFRQELGITPRQYAEALREGAWRHHLKSGASVLDAIFAAGYGSAGRAYATTHSALGMTPARYQQGALAMHIRYTTFHTALGQVLIAATSQGVCFLSLGDDAAILIEALREEFPRASLEETSDGFDSYRKAVEEHLAGVSPRLDLPLDVQATAFQKRVWDALNRIPYGETRSYREIAASLGQPTATRAVARACATNPVSLAIPCHRAVRTSGHLAGYRWGLERKARLLALERECASGVSAAPVE
jgi:AraC family transcriptional regulator, regulatory protein of adaptative response / methylated-DNA-[protein]-cysteine methyltransferase